jgi:GH25 family lysozyme M1 (1,4-beta-N-acetylmuramidase)
MRPVVIDISRYQEPMDWATAAIAWSNSDFELVVHRATIATSYTDPYFGYAMTNILKYVIPYSAYHVVRCDYPAKAQINNFINVIKANGATRPWFPLVLDCELDNGKSKAVIAQIIYDCCHCVEDLTGKPPVIYSRRYWVQDHVGDKKWLNDYKWWLAYYPSPLFYDWKKWTKPPTPPNGVDPANVILHQVSQSADGKVYGVYKYSKSIDVSFWLPEQSLDDYMNDYRRA